MMKSVIMSTFMALAAGAAFAQLPPVPMGTTPADDTIVTPDTPEFLQCISTVFPFPINLLKTEDGYQIRSEDAGILFAQSASCADNKAILNSVVLIGDTLKAGQEIGSAMKADSLTVWAPPLREGCAIPVDYGFDIKNFRWFNWNDGATDGGNKRFEVIRGADGDEVRISTMSHLRLGDMIWSPRPEDAGSPCAVSGKFEASNLDVRWSRGGTASGLLADRVQGDVSVPVLLGDARKATDLAKFMVSGTGLSTTDITESQTMRARRFNLSAKISQGSTVPWAFLINKYAHDLIYRKSDDSLLLRILPLDLANTFHFTTGTAHLSLPEATIIPGAFLPSSYSMDLGSINMSSLFSGAEIAVALRGEDKGTFKMNARGDGVGVLEAEVDFQTQLFGKDLLNAASRGNVNLQGKTGPGIVGAAISFEDTGFSQAFLSLMKSRPSTTVIRTATSHMAFWQQISTWLSDVESGQKSTLSVLFGTPQLMIDGFWNRAPEGAIARVIQGG